jgi:hypothetical protein
VDFKGLHVAMLYAEAGQEMTIDPYDIPKAVYHSYPKEMLRTLVKKLTLTAINAKDKSSAYKAFREGFPAGHLGKRMKNEKLDELMGAFLTLNPILSDFMFSDQGIRLMNLDSQITSHVHRHFTEQKIPTLSVHDSYIVDNTKVAELRDIMAEASKAVVGRALPTSISLPDKPEYSEISDYELGVHIENRKTSRRCVGYMDRLFSYQERTGRSICPVDRGDAWEDYWSSISS